MLCTILSGECIAWKCPYRTILYHHAHHVDIMVRGGFCLGVVGCIVQGLWLMVVYSMFLFFTGELGGAREIKAAPYLKKKEETEISLASESIVSMARCIPNNFFPAS